MGSKLSATERGASGRTGFLRPPFGSIRRKTESSVSPAGFHRFLFFSKWAGAELNRRHHDFQSCALPTELPTRFRARPSRSEPRVLPSYLGDRRTLVKRAVMLTGENSARRRHLVGFFFFGFSSSYLVRDRICFSANHWRMAYQRRFSISAQRVKPRPSRSKSPIMAGS